MFKTWFHSFININNTFNQSDCDFLICISIQKFTYTMSIVHIWSLKWFICIWIASPGSNNYNTHSFSDFYKQNVSNDCGFYLIHSQSKPDLHTFPWTCLRVVLKERDISDRDWLQPVVSLCQHKNYVLDRSFFNLNWSSSVTLRQKQIGSHVQELSGLLWTRNWDGADQERSSCSENIFQLDWNLQLLTQWQHSLETRLMVRRDKNGVNKSLCQEVCVGESKFWTKEHWTSCQARWW